MDVLDTGILFEIAKDSLLGRRIVDTLEGRNVAITAVSFYEFLRGESSSVEVLAFLDRFPILNFGKEDAWHSSRIYQELKRTGNMTNAMDVLIAGSCQAHGATIHTLDSDFTRISGLQVEMYKKT